MKDKSLNEVSICGQDLINSMRDHVSDASKKQHKGLFDIETHMRVHAMMPGRPFVKSLKSKYFPNLGFNSIPM